MGFAPSRRLALSKELEDAEVSDIEIGEAFDLYPNGTECSDVRDWDRLHEKLSDVQSGTHQLGECLDAACTEAEAKQAERDALAASKERLRVAAVAMNRLHFGSGGSLGAVLDALIACRESGDLEPPATGAEDVGGGVTGEE